MSVVDPELAITRMRRWVEAFIVPLNICPFARKEVLQQSIRYLVHCDSSDNAVYAAIEKEVKLLQQDNSVETTLLILPELDNSFEQFLNSAGLAQQVILVNGWGGDFQIANFHPDYVFADSTPDDAANYTNRAPHAALHLLREASVERAVRAFKHAETIPKQNIDRLRALGITEMQQRLADIYHDKEKK